MLVWKQERGSHHHGLWIPKITQLQRILHKTTSNHQIWTCPTHMIISFPVKNISQCSQCNLFDNLVFELTDYENVCWGNWDVFFLLKSPSKCKRLGTRGRGTHASFLTFGSPASQRRRFRIWLKENIKTEFRTSQKALTGCPKRQTEVQLDEGHLIISYCWINPSFMFILVPGITERGKLKGRGGPSACLPHFCPL